VNARGRRIAVVTGTRAEWGLLAPVCRAIAARKDLSLVVLAGGAHLLAPRDGGHPTIAEVSAFVQATAGVELRSFAMQRDGESGRAADAEALGRGVSALAAEFARSAPDLVVVLGDRIEAFAAASAASVGGHRVAHIHGGDRAEGVADEAMRHAITKLAHMHLAASRESAVRIERMGEARERIHLVGSPAIDGLSEMRALDDAARSELGSPDFVFLMHPTGRAPEVEERDAAVVLEGLARRGRVLALMPNSDPGREGIVRAIDAAIARGDARVRAATHLPRARFMGLLKHAATRAIVGNSSAALIECAALGVRALDIGSRQAGRERADNVRHVDGAADKSLAVALDAALDALCAWTPSAVHPYLDGGASERIAELLSNADLAVHGLAKRNAY
jgi:UDP-hydrolysing UDP-N-acetyl-D-glucosamine 2-epimerase